MSSPVLLSASASDIVAVGSGGSSGVIAFVTVLSRSIYSGRGRMADTCAPAHCCLYLSAFA